MNKTPAEATALINQLKPLVANATCDVVVGVPFVDIPAALEAVKGSNIAVSAQNCHWETAGAFTGEVSAPMLAEMGVQYVIIGHSERRQYFGETDLTVQKRVRAALNAGLTVIVCVGETLEQREQGITGEVCALQTKIALGGVTKEEMARVIIAYEPVWAIGTGLTPSAADVEEAHAHIRAELAKVMGEDAAKTRILYGGSVKPSNARELMAVANVDGALVGGASLKASDFLGIAEAYRSI